MEAVSVQQMLAELPAYTQNQLHELAEAFIAENQNINLSAHRTKGRVWIGNIMDSLAAVEWITSQYPSIPQPLPPVEEGLGMEGLKILDLGTGGGFPLLPLAIVFPNASFTGMDSVKKKMDAVQRIVDTLNLANISLITGRAEELGNNPKYRESYDIVTARAVAETRLLLEYCAPFVKVGGHILLWKSMNIDDEISSSSRAEAELYLQKKSSISYELGGDWPAGHLVHHSFSDGGSSKSDGWGSRQILIYEKIKSTPKEYPRSVGSAKKSPL
jgi:16S rRNA (guanine527-N7)-methyltransferase